MNSKSETVAAAKREMAKGMSKKLDGNRSIPGNAAELRHALERILDIEGYGAPWIEAKCIAQKALEGEQCSPPPDQESLKIEQPGNAAALREALEELVNHHCRNCPEDTQYGCGVNIGGLLGFKCTLLKQARAALAAPPRNCDRFGSYEDALDYWREHVECAEDNGSFDVWLMARAEGGAE